MPMYEYACQKCEHSFEALVFNGEAVECPECHGQRVKRLLSVPAKPRSQGQSLPISCDPKSPQCGPSCCKL